MYFLADENFPELAVEALRLRGHDVKWVKKDSPGISDPEVLERAAAEGRTVLTLDTDFGEYTFRWGLPIESGIILFRITPQSASLIAEITVSVVETRTDWSGHFSVADGKRIRMTPLPQNPD